MENPRLLSADTSPYDRNASGIWTVEAGHVASVEDFASGPSVGLVKTENVLLLAVELPPIASKAKRAQLLPFAVEDRIADKLEDVHVALGAELAPNVFLAGIVRHDLMRQWVAALEDVALDHCSLVPDALSLPVPESGTWAVDLAGQRALVRTAEGIGFALPVKLLEQAWAAAERPRCASYGDPLPPQMHAASVALEPEPLAERLQLPALDLRQGPYALPRRPIHPLWKRIATVAAIGAAAHAGIAAADAMALRTIADEREAEVRLLAQTVQPSLALGPDFGAAVAQFTPPGPVGAPSAFLPLLSRSGNATARLGFPVEWRTVRFSQPDGNLVLELGVGSGEQLVQVGQALQAAGLSVTPGPARADGGMTVATFTVR